MVVRKPAYGGESEAERLRRLHEAAQRELSQALAAMDTTPHGECSHPATYIARVCASCSTVLQVDA